MTEKKKILVWLENYSIHFGITKAIQEKYDCDLFALISCSPKQKHFFNSQKLINFKKKMFVRDHVHLKKNEPDIQKLQSLEKLLQIQLSKIIYGDRLFYKFNKYHTFSNNEIYSIIEQELNYYNNILDEISPDFVIMRAPEFQDIELFYEVCKSKNIPVLILSSMKFGARWLISSKPYPPIQFDMSDNQITLKSFEELREGVKLYSKMYNKIFSSKGKTHAKTAQKFNAAKLLYSTFSSSNINSYHDVGKTPWSILTNVIFTSLLRKYRKTFIDKNAEISIPFTKPFAYFPLHVEPDATILRMGDFYTNQISLIKNIAQSLPTGVELFVKEHPTMDLVGWRNLEFYKQIIELPNVKLIHPSVKNELMLQNSSFLITIAGTAALEAIFYEKPVIVFSDVNCSTISSVFKINDLKELPIIIRKCLETKVNLNEVNYFFNQMEKDTFVCDVEHLNVDSSSLFGIGGLLNMNSISENLMKTFLEENKNDFDKLAMEHIKKIENH
jgi:hypothetical protein